MLFKEAIVSLFLTKAANVIMFAKPCLKIKKATNQ